MGLFQEANEGTIFLDEIGEMSIELQAKLLRVLEARTFIRVGETKETKVNVRVITATNRNLTEEIGKGRFREDLFYRLSVFQIHLPALRDQTEDIRQLALFFVQHFAANVNKRIAGMSPDFLKALLHHGWKGNVRELKNVIERTVILSDQEELTASLLPYVFNTLSLGENSLELQKIEKNHILKVLAMTGGNKTHAALNIGLTTLYQKIKGFQLS